MDEGKGVLYVLTNVSMPGLVKIGCTTGSVQDRVRELSSSTSVPFAFECHFAAYVENMAAKERTLHQLFGEQRVNPRREFFSIAPEKVVLAISMGSFKEVTHGKPNIDPVEEKALEKAVEAERKRRSNINLSAIGIPAGIELTLSRDENLRATVVDGNKVLFEGQVMSLSAAALKALSKLGYTTPAVSGSAYWMLNGDTLDEIRVKNEESSFTRT